MFSNIFNTFTTKSLSALINFLMVILTTQFLGPEGRGEISIFITNVAVVILVNNIIGGGAIAYLASRHNTWQLLIPAYSWAIVAAGFTTFFLFMLLQVSPGFAGHLFVLSLVHSFTTINIMLLLGKEKVKEHNYVFFLQTALLLLALLIFFILLDKVEVLSYIYSLYVAYGLAFFLSCFYIFRIIGKPEKVGFFTTVKAVAAFGMVAQVSNMIMFLNYRLSYYFLNYFESQAVVGVFSVGVALSESIKLIGSSISLVLFARIANTDNEAYAKKITLKLLVLSFYLTTSAVIFLLLLPENMYTFIFGDGFSEVKHVIFTISPGIAAIGVSIIISHYYSGRGMYFMNNYAALLGFMVTITGCFLLIPLYGLTGAGIVASMSYMVSLVFLLYKFNKESKLSLNLFVIRKEDIAMILDFMKKAWQK